MHVRNNWVIKYTLGISKQGLSNYLRIVFPIGQPKFVIAYDCRLNSVNLEKVVAYVFFANWIQMYLFSDLDPTPELSFALKYFGCQWGILLTALSNSSEFNEYKVYWQDGGQIVPPENKGIVIVIEQLKFNQIKFKANKSQIQHIIKEVNQAFIESLLENASSI